MSYRRMTFVERMDVFKLLYFENMSPTQIAQRLRRSPSSITREVKHALDDAITFLSLNPAQIPYFVPR